MAAGYEVAVEMLKGKLAVKQAMNDLLGWTGVVVGLLALRLLRAGRTGSTKRPDRSGMGVMRPLKAFRINERVQERSGPSGFCRWTTTLRTPFFSGRFTLG